MGRSYTKVSNARPFLTQKARSFPSRIQAQSRLRDVVQNVMAITAA